MGESILQMIMIIDSKKPRWKMVEHNPSWLSYELKNGPIVNCFMIHGVIKKCQV